MNRPVIFCGVLALISLGGLTQKALAITAAEEPLVLVVQKTLPSVVNIDADRIVRGQVTDPFNLFFGRYYQQKISSLGSGVMISPDGYIVTCAHVVGRAENGQVKATFSDGSVYRAKVLASDEDIDLALLKIEDGKTAFPYLDIKTLSPNLLGETVMALGNPVNFQSSVSQGILSAKNRSINTEQGTANGLLQTDAAINPGNSGGPLVDIEGKFVGISSAKFTGQAVEGIGFAIPGELVSNWTAEALAIVKGEKKAPTQVSLIEVLRQRFGFTAQELTPELAQSFGLATTSGLLLADVEKGGPAEKIGMRPGMLIVRIGNVPIEGEDSLPRQLRKLKTGDPVAFTIAVAGRQGNMTIQRSQAVTLISR